MPLPNDMGHAAAATAATAVCVCACVCVCVCERPSGERSEAVQPIQELEGASTRARFLENHHQPQSRATQLASGR